MKTWSADCSFKSLSRKENRKRVVKRYQTSDYKMTKVSGSNVKYDDLADNTALHGDVLRD